MAGERLVELYARLDLPTLQSDDVKEKLTQVSNPVLGGGMFSSLEEVTGGVLPLWSTLLQFLVVLLHFAREPEGPTLIAISFSSLLTLSYLYANTYSACESSPELRACPLADLACSLVAVFVAHAVNRNYLRAKAVAKLVSDEKTQKEVISGGLLPPMHQGMHRWVVPDRNGGITIWRVEYSKNIKELGTVSLEHPWRLIGRQPFNISDLLASILDDLPLVGQFHLISRSLLMSFR